MGIVAPTDKYFSEGFKPPTSGGWSGHQMAFFWSPKCLYLAKKSGELTKKYIVVELGYNEMLLWMEEILQQFQKNVHIYLMIMSWNL